MFDPFAQSVVVVVLSSVTRVCTSLQSLSYVLCADHPILRKEAEAAVQSLKNWKSAGVDNNPAELVRAGGEDVDTALTTISNKIWQTGEGPTMWTQS